MPSRRLFRDSFPWAARGAFGRMWLRQEIAGEHLLELSLSLADPSHIPSAGILKRTDDRLVFRWQPEGARHDWVVKAYYPRKWRHWFRERRRAYGESLSQLCAERRGLPTTAACGYGEIRRGSRPCVFICGEYAPLQSMRECFLEGPPADRIEGLLNRSGAMLRKLYLAGCNHVDFGPHAMLISAASTDGDRLIDFESASFLRRPSLRTFAAQAGYYAWSVATNRDWVKPQAVEQWFASLLKSIDRHDDVEMWDIWRTCFQARQSLQWRIAVR